MFRHRVLRTPLCAVLMAAALTACGSTVQMTSRASLNGIGDGLGAPAGSTGDQPTSTTGASVPSTSGSTTGSTGAALPQSGTTGTTGTSATTTVIGPSSSPAARITSHQPIELGFLTTSASNAGSAGVNTGQSFSDRAMYAALVSEYNVTGGLGGHKIVPVYGQTDTASSDWSGQYQAACESLTVDHKVKAVLGYSFVWLDSFEKCLGNHKVTHLYGGYQPGDVQAQADFPNVISSTHPTVDGLHRTVLAGAIASGRLTKATKLGIIVDGCGHGDRAFERSTKPFLAAQGITYKTVTIACQAGSGDVTSGLSAIKSAQLQFATAGVTVAFIPNNVELLFFMANAESQGYRPQYLAPGGGAAFEAQSGLVPPKQLENFHGYGWMPAIDVNPQHQPYAKTPAQTACLSKLAKHGLKPSGFNDYMGSYVTCDALELYRQALALTNGATDIASIRAAVLRVMPTFRGAATYAGLLGASSTQRGGAAEYRETSWNKGCSCFTYVGAARKLPTL